MKSLSTILTIEYAPNIKDRALLFPDENKTYAQIGSLQELEERLKAENFDHLCLKGDFPENISLKNLRKFFQGAITFLPEGTQAFEGNAPHDINNQLTIILGNTRLLLRKCDSDPGNPDYVEILKRTAPIDRAAQKIAQLIQRGLQ